MKFVFMYRVRRRRVRRRTKSKRTASETALFEKNKTAARRFVVAKLEEINRHYKVTYHRISIRSQRTRWGSCTKSGNLSFNYKIIFLPPHLAAYVIAHELCHLKEFNHGKQFWALVAQTIPHVALCKKELRGINLNKMQIPTSVGI